jgi:hypothetical protein
MNQGTRNQPHTTSTDRRPTTRPTEHFISDGAPPEPVSIDRDYEARYWARTLRCTEIELREAVRAVGTDVAEVRRYLGPRGG